MAGTDGSRERSSGPGPVVILVAPQLGENIGMVARAMLNCGLTELRLVTPREPWPNAKAEAAAAGADLVLDRARLFDSTAAAVADLQHVYATTARDRAMTKRIVTPRLAARELRDHVTSGGNAGLLFGREAKGLLNDDVALADTVIMAPLNPAFMSLNLAMAVLLVGWEWWMTADETPEQSLAMPKETVPAAKQDLIGLFEHLEQELDACGFLRLPGKREIMVRNLRNLFGRAALTVQEVRTLRGVIACLSDRRRGAG